MLGEGDLKVKFNIDLRKQIENKSENVSYYHNQEPVPHTYNRGRCLSCTGTMMSLLFKIADQACQDKIVNMDKMRETLTQSTQQIDLDPNIKRANEAIEAHNKSCPQAELKEVEELQLVDGIPIIVRVKR